MSVWTFIASNYPLKTFEPSHEYPVYINIDTGVIDDGNADDNYFLIDFKEVDLYTNKQYGVYLEWNYTDGRANQIIDYIKNVLKYTDTVEFWHVWLIDSYDFEDSPVIFKTSISINDLTIENIKDINDAPIFNHPDPRYPDRPSFYCLTIHN